MSYIIRVKSSDVIEKLLRSGEDFEILTPLEEFDNEEDETNTKKFEIYIENNFEKSRKSAILKDIQKKSVQEKEEIKQHGESHNPQSERHQG